MFVAFGTIWLLLCLIAMLAIMTFSVWDSIRDGYFDWREDCKKQKNKA